MKYQITSNFQAWISIHNLNYTKFFLSSGFALFLLLQVPYYSLINQMTSFMEQGPTLEG